MSALPPLVAELIERFAANRESYKSSQYNETRLRREFLDPFFDALGWDVANKQGYAEAYKDVIHEDALKIGATTKAPDYCFRIGGQRKFFVEAKKPSVNIKDDVAPSYQLRRYAWSAKLPISVLTDFEELAVFDCRVRPHQGDKASTARILYVSYNDYEAQWDTISGIFARESILKGSFDKYADGSKVGRRGTEAVDDAFLKEIETWREELARNLALRNGALSTADLNFSVQRIIDRIVFLRICEDRGAEPYGRLLGMLDSKGLYQRLCEQFRRADERYNSGLFHFADEKDRNEIADRLTLTLKVDDDVVRQMIGSLYYPASPYEFSVLPADILGQVYERFLGKVIRLTAGHQAKIEEKPEVRKAGGVYYTPRYVVDHIVAGTLGVLLADKSPNQAASVKVIDPACGSGSFLIGAYQYLLDWHKRWYVDNDPEKYAKGKNPALFRGRDGDWQLTIAKRKGILSNNIFGVDLDAQAVEVTKLSLLLKVLEGESAQVIKKTLSLFEERVLPDLGDNIQCGNSLIDVDYFAEADITSTDDPTNPFNWRARFPAVFMAGGFDAVIGNPPYLSYGGRQAVEIPESHTNYFACHYESVGWPTAHAFFMERSAKLLSKRFVSFIVPDQVGHLDGYGSLRTVFVRYGKLSEVKYWGEKVFAGVTTPALTFVLDKKSEAPVTRVIDPDETVTEGTIEAGARWNFSKSSELLTKLGANAMSIRPYIADCGVRTTDAKAQVVPIEGARGKFIPTLEGRVVGRYWCAPPIVGVRLDEGSVFKSKDEKYAAAKYLIRQTAAYPIVGPHDHATYFRNSLHALLEPEDGGVDIRYLVGILNSKVLRFAYVRMIREASQKAFPQVKLTPLGQLPVRAIDRTNPVDVKAHDKIVSLVESMLSLSRSAREEMNPSKLDALKNRIDATDSTIDAEIYVLYGLTDEEQAEVELSVAALAPPPPLPR